MIASTIKVVNMIISTIKKQTLYIFFKIKNSAITAKTIIKNIKSPKIQ